MQNSYHPASIALHWMTVLLLVAIYALIEFRGVFPKGTSAHDLMKTWHFMLGLTVPALVAARLVLRAQFPATPMTPNLPAWQAQLARAMHITLYAFLVIMPLLGWLTLSAKGKVIPFFGLQLPPLMGADNALAGSLEQIHGWIGTLGYWLIGLHAGAALLHHHVMHDDTLARMVPFLRDPTPQDDEARAHHAVQSIASTALKAGSPSAPAGRSRRR